MKFASPVLHEFVSMAKLASAGQEEKRESVARSRTLRMMLLTFIAIHGQNGRQFWLEKRKSCGLITPFPCMKEGELMTQLLPIFPDEILTLGVA